MPTWSSSSDTRLIASDLLRSKWASSASLICRPIVRTGFRLVIGSWKIIAMSRPRIRRSSRSERLKRSRSPSVAVPLVIRPARGRMPRSASEVTLFPQPDSPTMPSVSPGAMSKEMPLTA
jgi:hypothetical protein